jgi:hypothetical protein
MIQTQKTKPYVLGLSIGTLWLITAASASVLYAIIATTRARMPLIAVLVITGTLLAVSICYVMKATKLPGVPPSMQGRRIRQQFALIVVLEGVAIALVSTGCSLTGHFSWLVPLVLIIVGIHFMPLAKLFGVPRYMTLGWLFCIVSILTLLLVPAHAHVGAVFTRLVYSALGCAASAWLISVGNLLELRRLMP